MFCAYKSMHTCADGKNVRVRIDGVDDLSSIEAQAIKIERAAEEAVNDERVARAVHVEVNVIGADGNFNGG